MSYLEKTTKKRWKTEYISFRYLTIELILVAKETEFNSLQNIEIS